MSSAKHFKNFGLKSQQFSSQSELLMNVLVNFLIQKYFASISAKKATPPL